MTATDLIKDQLDDSGYQLAKVIDGMPESGFDHKLTDIAMTPREQIAHLCEAYECFSVNAGGGKYEWGTYTAETGDTAALTVEFSKQRQKAVSAALSDASDEKIKLANDYIVGHDYYHVGQMCLSRLAVQPDWDSYTIYRPTFG
jgi:hypothetical protein